MAAGHFKKWADTKKTTTGRQSLVKKKKGELTEYAQLLKDGVKELLGANETSDADMVTLGIERDSLKESLGARDSDLEGPRLTLRAKPYFFELGRNRL